MKKLYAILFLVALIHTGVYGQAKKPTIMVVPANVWCTHNGYTQKYNNQGTITEIPDYKKALDNDLMYLANLHTSFLCNLIYPTFSRILLYSC